MVIHHEHNQLEKCRKTEEFNMTHSHTGYSLPHSPSFTLILINGVV